MSEQHTPLQRIEAKLDEILRSLPEKVSATEEGIKATYPAELRADFMRRWFAIAISVGFASTVVEAEWLKRGLPPNQDEQAQFFRLIAALFATLFSWEGYFKSIKSKPLNDGLRYYLDVFLVFIYLTLLITSGRPEYWLFLHAATFIIYFFWDSLTIFSYPTAFGQSKIENERVISKAARWFEVYFLAPFQKVPEKRGPFITIIWGIYFFFIWAILPDIRTAVGDIFTAGEKWITAVSAIYVLYGVVFYRENKGRFRASLWFPWVVPALGAASLYLISYLDVFEAITAVYDS